ncbi:MAG TPA: GNAT family N-acetyltransferase [Pelomicrobium sp.]|nr:GNAT family N-acetyltransferase [Pelomicrobium sp.]
MLTDPRSYRVEDTLRNGTPIVIRAIRADDRERVRTAFGKLERETIYTRFFTYKDALTDKEIKDATDVDFDRTVALVVTTVESGEELAIAGGRYVAYRLADLSYAAEVSFTVEEDYHGQGLASRLLAHLAAIARTKGVQRFEAEVLPHNAAMLKVFEKSGLPLTKHRGDGVVHVELLLGPV